MDEGYRGPTGYSDGRNEADPPPGDPSARRSLDPRSLEHPLNTSSSVDPTSAPTFIELGADPLIAEALLADGIERAFPIQQMCLAMALDGKDIIGQAKTGTGKTLGFGIPLLQRIDLEGDRDRPQALVICPTRELGLQVATDLERAGRLRGVRVLAVTAAVPMSRRSRHCRTASTSSSAPPVASSTSRTAATSTCRR